MVRVPFRIAGRTTMLVGSVVCAMLLAGPVQPPARAEQPHPPFRVKWRFEPPEGVGASLLTPRAIYFAGQQRYGLVNPSTGRAIWQKAVTRAGRGSAGSAVAVDGHTLYVGVGRRLIACDARTGATRWQTTGDLDYPKLGAWGEALYYQPALHMFASRDGASGRRRWTIDLREAAGRGAKHDSSDALVIVPGSGLVCVGTWGGDLVGLSPSTGRTVWRLSLRPPGSKGDSKPSGAMTVGRRLYCTTDDGELLAVDTAVGRIAWRRRRAGVHFHDALLSRAILYAAATDGGLYAYRSSDGRPLWATPLPGPDRGRYSGIELGDRLRNVHNRVPGEEIAALVGPLPWEPRGELADRHYADVERLIGALGQQCAGVTRFVAPGLSF